MNWTPYYLLLLDWLCQIYQEWGGDCEDLVPYPDVESRATFVLAYIDGGGGTPPAISQYAGDGDALRKMSYFNSDPGLDAQDRAAFTAVVVELAA